MSISEIHQLFLRSTGVCTDSRKITEGCLYVALKGDHFDGNEFAIQALTQGAQYAIVDIEIDNGYRGLIKVKSGLKTLQNLAAFHLNYLTIPTVGITGSNGKTTTKELIGEVLSSSFKVLITEGNLNNHIGVPLTILRGTKEHEIAVIEMGANHIGDIEELCNIANPSIGLITNIGKAHLEGFGNLDGVIRTKGELFNHIESRNGKIILNLDQPLISNLIKGKPELTYGSTVNCDIQGEAEVRSGYLKVEWQKKRDLKKQAVQTQLVGSYNLDNVLAAISVGVFFNVEPLVINAAIANYSPSNNRSEFQEIGTNRIIWDAYNANPSSMEAALNSLESFNAKKVVLILGEMKEVGKDGTEEHNQLISHAKTIKPYRLILIGSAFDKCNTKNCELYKTVDDLKSNLNKTQVVDSLILIKGSRSNRLEELKTSFT